MLKELELEQKYSAGVINLQTYSRPHLVAKCLESIYAMEKAVNYHKIIVLQVGNREVEELVYDYADSKTQIIEVDGTERSPLQNMNFNRWLALEEAFKHKEVNWVLSIEEDVEVARESLLFIEQIYQQFCFEKKFRGINLGSILENPELLNTYSLQRFGVHGCGSVLTRRTWRLVKLSLIEKTTRDFPLDGALEGLVKSGFMVNPNITMYLDRGWDSGTHNKHTGEETHYVLNEKSWKTRQSKTTLSFERFDIQIPWRSDCIIYQSKDNPVHTMKWVIMRIYHAKSMHKLFSYCMKLRIRIKDYLASYNTH